jgi:murein DD-endopeptidase MepM/ murein hydrolase activator NlpD
VPDYRLATRRAAQKIGVDPGILLRLVNQESGFNPNARSGAGAQGIAQFMPGTARAYGVNLNDNRVTDDLEGAARYLRANLDKYGSYARALSVYNSGRPDAYKDPNFAKGQTYNYVRNILHGQTPSVGQGHAGGSRVGSGSASVTVTPGTAQNGFDPGAQTGVPGLAGLLQQPQAPPVGVPVAPTPAIQSPVIQPPVVQGNGLADALAAIQTGPQSLPETSTSSPSVKVSGGGPTASAASAGSAGSGRYPTGRVGKIIGTPYAGTHTLGNWQSDNAVDIAVPVGTPMVALQSGTVVKVRHHPQDGGRFAGDQITIRGANGNEYFYAHGVADVRPGQRIRKGQSLGTTGAANGVAHLHFGQMKGDPRMHTRAGR